MTEKEDNTRMQMKTEDFGEQLIEGVTKEAAEEAVEEAAEEAVERKASEEEPVRHRKGLNNDGVGVIEIILILVVLVTLVLIFKNQLTSIVERAMAALEKSMDKILG